MHYSSHCITIHDVHDVMINFSEADISTYIYVIKRFYEIFEKVSKMAPLQRVYIIEAQKHKRNSF